MINIENPDEIYEWDTEKLYNAVQSIPEPDKETMETIEEGVDIEFPIDYLIQEWYEVYPTTRKAKIYGYGKITLKQFMKEKKARDKLMRQLIEEEINTTGSMKPRT